MMIGGKIPELTANDDVPLKEYGHCLAKIICNPPQPDCYFQTCSSCPGISDLKEHLYALMDENIIDAVQYKQWVSTDRSALETIIKPSGGGRGGLKGLEPPQLYTKGGRAPPK